MRDLRKALLYFAMTGVLPLHAAVPPERDARVTDFTAQVFLRPAEKSGQQVLVDGEAPLREGDILETGPKSRAEVTIDGETVFHLEPNSALKMKNLSVHETELELPRGAMLAKVKPLTDPSQSLIVKMPTAVVAVRGTELGVETANGLSRAGVFGEGLVTVSGAWGHEQVRLAPYQETMVSRSAIPQLPRGLAHFRAYEHRMPHLRARAAYWSHNWKPIPAWQRHEIRQSLAHGRRPAWIHRAPPRALRRVVRPPPALRRSPRRPHRANRRNEENS